MNEFATVIKDVLDKATQFSKSITHLHVKPNEDGTILVVAPSTDRSIEIRATSKKPVPELEGVACLHNLLYLKQILSSSLLKKADVEMTFKEASNRKTNALYSLSINGDKFSTFYQAVDPFLANIVMPQRAKITDWPVQFSVDKDAARDFKEARTIQAAAPKGNTARDEVFELVYGEGDVMAFFGSDKNQSVLVLCSNVDGGKKKQTGLFMIDHFARLLETGKEEVRMDFAPKALRVKFETPSANYEAILTAKKIMED